MSVAAMRHIRHLCEQIGPRPAGSAAEEQARAYAAAQLENWGLAAALVSAWLITVANIPAQIVEILRPFIDNKTLLMVMLMLLVLIVGTALDFAPTVLILTPVLMPLVREAGIDPVYFGVLFIMNNAIGLLTPPVGTVLNVVCGVGRIPMHDVIRGVMPFLASQVVVMGLLIAFPSLVMLPLKWLLMK